uniref:Uncharacterized protein n=1 Tax=Cajanus cajan TaxID=3821 RepID=A0A151T1G3_CAJCA|nr:hypothetical protein KK1_023283 [Cajanus cajan]
MSLQVFLSFYQLKLGAPPYGVLSLNGGKDGGLFTLYSQSYKNYKQEFSRVALVGVDPLQDEVFHFGGLPKFPFYWCPDPSGFNGVDSSQLTASEVAAVENLKALPRPLDVKLILSLESSLHRERGLESEYPLFLKGELVSVTEERLHDAVIIGSKEEEIAAQGVGLSALEAENVALKRRLEEVERSLVVEHKRGFLKAARQARFLAPGFDFSSMHVEKVVRFGKLVREDDIEDSSSDNASA